MAYAGEYDGVWVTPELPGYFLLHNDNNTLVLALIEDDFDFGDVLLGSIIGNVANTQNLNNVNNTYQLRLVVTSATTATGTITGCSGNHCEYLPPIGVDG